ncbi:V-set and immunoglobulin domain-containing protein 1 [Alligator mississippiensis]|uniref:V-set and immunoglobulin domain-containing protein 1 n=1 Tax=Alligator mississippiensis TaxID=8496 RepID=UPI0006EC7E62|nr:V-set and immunoglobulin domain-containing protein 1 [Alligator mississippiensis]KYO38269.1 V-set and immunoglobulin domain-containing protein 1 isoform A [Alligator mississippiensis]
MFAAMLKIFTIIAALSGHISSVTVTVPQYPVNVTVGGNTTLLCTYTTSGSLENLFIQWTFYNAKEKQQSTIYFYQHGQSYEYGKFQNRITAATNPGNASITISNMQPSDTGLYNCEVLNPQDPNGQNQKSVVVRVLVKPSQPFCNIQGTPESNHFISLACHSQEGMPLPTYQWQRLSGNTVKPVTEQYNPETGLLIIGNLTTFETGHYLCTASNILGNSSCQLDLTEKHSEGSIIAGALIGAILAAVVICIIVWILTKKEKKKRKEKATINEMQPMTEKQQTNLEYVDVPNEENIPTAAAPLTNTTNEQSNPEEATVPGMPENEEVQGGEREVTD